MIRTGGITRRRTDAAVFFGDEFARDERLLRRVSPKFLAHALVQVLGERFGKTIGQRLGQDRGIIVIGMFVSLDHGFLADPDRYLHHLFTAEAETVTQYIQRRRLEECARADKKLGRPLSSELQTLVDKKIISVSDQ